MQPVKIHHVNFNCTLIQKTGLLKVSKQWWSSSSFMTSGLSLRKKDSMAAGQQHEVSAEVCFSTRMWDGRMQPELALVLFEMTASEYLENDSTGVAHHESALWALVYQGGPSGPCWGRLLQWGSVENIPKHAQNICTHITKLWLHWIWWLALVMHELMDVSCCIPRPWILLVYWQTLHKITLPTNAGCEEYSWVLPKCFSGQSSMAGRPYIWI